MKYNKTKGKECLSHKWANKVYPHSKDNEVSKVVQGVKHSKAADSVEAVVKNIVG